MFRFIRDRVDEVDRPQRLERRSRAFARPGRLVSDRMNDRLQIAESAMAERIRAIFDEHDVVLAPVMSEPAVRAGIMEGRGATVTYFWETAWVPFSILWNITGQPAASVPAGLSPEGLPVAVQLVGRPGDERTILSLSAQIEADRPWDDPRPAVR
jgi:amidase